MLFNQLSIDHEDGTSGAERKLRVTMDATRTTILGLLGALAILGTIVLYATSKDAGATALLSIAEGILFGGFGISIGENSGANAAASAAQAGK